MKKYIGEWGGITKIVTASNVTQARHQLNTWAMLHRDITQQPNIYVLKRIYTPMQALVKKLLTFAIILGVLLIIGTAGSVDIDAIPLTQAVKQVVGSLVIIGTSYKIKGVL
jgi:hypothetical protein